VSVTDDAETLSNTEDGGETRSTAEDAEDAEALTKNTSASSASSTVACFDVCVVMGHGIDHC